MIARVHLDWSGARHWSDVVRPCRCCGGGAHDRDEQGRPCHQWCAEAELAAEVVGACAGQLVDERVGAWPAAARGPASEAEVPCPCCGTFMEFELVVCWLCYGATDRLTPGVYTAVGGGPFVLLAEDVARWDAARMARLTPAEPGWPGEVRR